MTSHKDTVRQLGSVQFGCVQLGYVVLRIKYVLLLATTVSCFVLGCGGGTELDVAPAEGVVTLDGNPVDRAGIIFQPNQGPVSTGVTDAEGRFRLMTGKINGALVGTHRIVVSKSRASSTENSQATSDTLADPSVRRRKSKRLFPIRYARVSTSGLEETVVRGEKNTFELHLTSQDSKK